MNERYIKERCFETMVKTFCFCFLLFFSGICVYCLLSNPSDSDIKEMFDYARLTTNRLDRIDRSLFWLTDDCSMATRRETK